MKERRHTWILAIYWLALALSAIFLYFDLPYVVVTESVLMPLLLCYILLGDDQIGKPTGKFVFYIGLLFAFAGDVLQVVISNELFFAASLVAFMLMNIFYAVSFYKVRKPGKVFWICLSLLALASCIFVNLLGNEFGDYRLPLIIYMVTVSCMISFAANISAKPALRGIAIRYLIPGALIFLFQNIVLALNLFHFNGDNRGYVVSIIPYGIAQYLLAMGAVRIFIPPVPGRQNLS